nr:hypothetical protein [Burkholderia catarinensis]
MLDEVRKRFEAQLGPLTALPEARASDKCVRLRNFLHRFHKPVSQPEREGLAAAVWTIGFNPHLVDAPHVTVPALSIQAEARRHVILEHFETHDTMPHIDQLGLVIVIVNQLCRAVSRIRVSRIIPELVAPQQSTLGYLT